MSFTSSLLFLATLQAAASPASVTIDPQAAEIAVGTSMQLTAHALDANGAVLTDVSLRWFSSNPDVAIVDRAGQVAAVSPGETRIFAAAGAQRGFATITVPQLPPASIALRMPFDAVPAGASAQLLVTVETRTGTKLDDAGVRFESSDLGIASVDALGRVFGRQPGTARVRATMGGVSQTIAVRVVDNPAAEYRIVPDGGTIRTGDVIRFRVEAPTPDGEFVAGISPAWSMSGTGAQIETEGADGVFVADSPGRYQITARVGEEISRSTIVTVAQRSTPATLTTVGRGPHADTHSGDVWVFEGMDGRDYAYIGTLYYDWMKVWDVTDPTNPVLTDSMQLDARRINDVKIHPNNRVGILTREGASNRRNGIVILDLSTPSRPTIASEYTETVTGGVHNVWITPDDIVYAVHNGTSDVHMIDISDPRNPAEVGTWGLAKDASQKSLHDIIVQNGYAYLSYWDDGLIMLDVGAGTHGGTPTNPVQVSQFKYPIGNSHTAWRHGRYLFLGDEIFPPDWDPDRPIDARGYIHVLDMGDPEHPREVGKYEVPEAGAHNMWVEGDRLYVGYYQGGLRVVDISGELRGDLYRQGRELAVLKTTDENSVVPNWPMTWGAQVFKGHVFAWDLNSGLWVTKLEETVIIP
jgi:hypothetical protein